MVTKKEIISVKEVQNELKDSNDRLSSWVKEHKEFFEIPSKEELIFLSSIFEVKHFQSLIRKQQQLHGKPVADPFVIAKAKIINGTVVTTEKYKENAAKIPNVCQHFKINCINLEQFMEDENWTF